MKYVPQSRGDYLRKRIFIAALVISIFSASSVFAGEGKVKIVPPKEPFKVTKCTGRMPLRLPEPGEPPKVAYFIGCVELEQGNISVVADAVVAWISSVTADLPGGQENRVMISEFYAEGNVFITDRTDFLQAERIYYNVIEDRGYLQNGRLKSTRMNMAKYRSGRIFEDYDEPPDLGPRATIPLYFRAAEMRMKGKGAYEAKDAGFSPCSFGEPHWGVTSTEASINPAGTIDASGNTLWLWGIPIPLPPVRIEEDFQPPLKRIRYQYTNKWGHTFLTEWNITTKKNYGAGLILDSYAQVGRAWGADLFYGSKKLKDLPFYGTFEYYSLTDHSGYLTPEGDNERYRLHITHRQILPKDFRLEAEIMKVSDDDFLPEFLPREYYANRTQETWAMLKKFDQNRTLAILYKTNLNDFFNQTEYAPQIALYDFTEHLGLGVYQNLVLTAGYAGESFECEALTNFKLGRFDISNTLSRPIDAGPYVTIIPFVRGRFTSWENKYYTDLTGYEDRTLLDAGLDLSTEISKIYDFKSEALKIEKIRHIIRPSAVWSKNIYNDMPKTALPVIDETETVFPENKITFTLENIVQKKAKEKGKDKISDLARLKLSIPIYPENDINAPGEYFGRGEADFEAALGDFAAIDFNGEYNPGLRRFDIISVGLLTKYSPFISTYVGERWEGNLKQKVNVQLKVSPTVRWDFMYGGTFDLFKNEVDSQAFWMRRYFHQWALEFGYEVNYDTSERVFSVYFSPMGLFKSKPSVFRRAGGVFDPRL